MDENKRAILEFPPPSPGFIPSKLPFFVVGIGTSAGGIQTLSRFLESMPSDNGMAFVIVIHLSPQHESTIDQILQKKTAMPVLQVNETVHIKQNHVYIIPPTKDLVMSDGELKIVDATRPQGRHVAIDMFLRTLAETHRERAIAIILSGAGGDGAVGITRIKEKGGMAIAQSPEDAEYDSMPRTAISTGTVDFVLPVAEMPEKLLELTRKAASIELPAITDLDRRISLQAAEAPTQDTEMALRKVLLTLHQRTGHDFHHYKRATILRRLERRLQVAGMPNVVAYQGYLEQHDTEVHALLQDMLIGVTNFFRDRKAFEALERDVLPKIFNDTEEAKSIRAWSVGCATGQEAYSIAMLLAEQNSLKAQPRLIQVFGSDIDERAITMARKGQYPESIITDVTPGRLRQFFEKEDWYYCVRKEIREQVLFAVHNILHDPPFSRLHLISCRNLLIYLDRDIQKKVFELLHYALCPGGYLFLGSAESAEAASDLFVPIDKKNRIYQASKAGASSLHTMPQNILTRRRPGPSTLPSVHSERQELPAQEVHRRLMEEFGMPSMLIDQQDNVLYATQQAWRYMRPPTGEPSQNIFAIVHPDLRLDLRSALFQAKQSQEYQETTYLPVRLSNDATFVRILVRPVRQKYAGIGASMLLFEEAQEVPNRTMKPRDAGDSALASHLEVELRDTKEQLRSVIEQYETVMADLRASNEELQSINEELRSTSEELETSKEELQSLNEELMTVNAELKSKMEETVKANDDLQNFVTATAIATIFIDRSLRIQRYTKPANTLFNVIASDIGRPLSDITHHLDYPDLLNDIEQVFERLQTKDREVSSNGKWYIARLLPYRTSQDHIAGVMLTFIDISKRREAEDQLRLSEQRMRLIADSATDYAIVTLDANGLVTSWNRGAEYLFGYTEREMLGKSAELLYPPADRAAGEFKSVLKRACDEGRVEDDRWRLRKDGNRVFCSGITSPLTSETISGYVEIARDVTGPMQAQEQQAANLVSEKAGRAQAEEEARLRDEFFAVLSHELKQPLNLIQLTTERMRRLPESATQPALVRGMTTIKRMVESQVKIIDDLMDLSRLHTGKLSFSYGQVNLNDTVSHMVDHMQMEATQKQIALSLELPENDLFISGDAVRIEQIIWNLLSNALKFTPAKGKVDVRLTDDGKSACIQVSDTGVGIAPENLPQVFDMFRQGDTGTARRYGGLGIGLALVRQLVEGHGGHVEAHSEGPGRGAQFRAFLLLNKPPQDALPATGADKEGTLTGRRILLVDDDAETVESLSNLLSIEGAEVLAATSAAEALKIVHAHAAPFDLIISDIGMPEMDGYGLLRELRKLAPTASTPAIALSGYTRPNDVKRTLDAGFTSHLRKPVSLDELMDLARSVYRKAGTN